jgi:hypothetical protein
MRKATCACGAVKERQEAGYCRACANAANRAWRVTHPLSAEQRVKANARAYAREYRKRGKLIPQPCEKCGDPAQMHHDDYSKPLAVRWMCRPCHGAHHWAEPH